MVYVVRLAEADAGEVLTLQRAAYLTEARRYQDLELPPLVQTFDEVAAELRRPTTIALGARHGHRLVGSARLRIDGALAHLGRLVVAPDRQGQGIGSLLLVACERAVPAGISEVCLFTGDRSEATIRLYERHGYERRREEPCGTYHLVHLTKKLAGRELGPYQDSSS